MTSRPARIETRGLFRLLFIGASALGVLLSGCPDQGVLCSAGLSRCGTGCADLEADRLNCGACGAACQIGEVCREGRCTCPSGAERCGAVCAVTSTDPSHCGGCGRPCAQNQVCEAGQCKASCALGSSTRCGQSCVDLRTDPAHCGGCNRACVNEQTCRDGVCTYDLVAACITNGQVVGIQAGADVRGPLVPLGAGPQALAVTREILYSGDFVDQRLYSARIESLGDGGPFQPLPGAVAVGKSPNHVLVDGKYLYVIDSLGNTLLVVEHGGTPMDAGVDAGTDAGTDPGSDAGAGMDGGTDGGEDGGALWNPPEGSPILHDGGFSPMAAVAQLSFGPNTAPQAMVKVGNFLYVPLWGGFGAAAAEGQKVARVDVTDPRNPKLAGAIDLSGIDLRTFDGGAAIPRPYSIAALGSALYVALNNLDPSFSPAGPGLLARIELADGGVRSLDLGADACLNAGWVAVDGDRLLVSCIGRAQFDSSFNLVGVDKAALVMVDGDGVRKAAWPVRCPQDAGTGCALPLPGRFAVKNGRVYLADGNGGRIFVVERAGEQLSHRSTLQACTPNPTTGYSNVADVVSVP